ncbi:MAG: hypothetical protein KatS3mg105_1405 [Gemmatales bacterium]|nr:MAG: hypothetical protein KatS3mg105_1405 [Gemmatales bacterium]
MPFLLLFLLALVCLPDSWPQPLAWIGVSEGNPFVFAAATWGGVAAFGFWAFITAQRASFLIRIPQRRDAALGKLGRSRRWHFSLLSLFLVVSVYLLGWGWTVEQFATFRGELIPGAELFVLAPYLFGLVISWLAFYDADLAAHDTSLLHHRSEFFSRWSYVSFHLRQKLALIIAPLLLLIFDKGLRRIVPEPHWQIQIASAFFLLAIVFLGLPWILRIALGLASLPDGELRNRLEQTARRLNFRCTDILLWNTHGAIANAMVAGFLPWLRYVLLTDRLISELTPDEVEAVFGHEIGHVKHRHMYFYLGFLLISLLVVAGLWNLTAAHFLAQQPSLADPRTASAMGDLELLPLVMLSGGYIFLVFGFLSRRCERQADIFGCRTVSCQRPDCTGHDDGTPLAPNADGLCPTGINTFISALEKVAAINGISRHKPGWLQSWQHSTIARRVEFLQDVLQDFSIERRFQRTVFWVKSTLLAILVAAFVMLGQSQGWQALGFF